MIITFLAAVLLTLIGVRFHRQGIRPDYISISSTMAVKGFFVLLVFLRHYKGFVELEGPLDQPFLTLDSWLSQLIVALFLFYSGYGVYLSWMKKGDAYRRTMPKKRLLATLLHFDLAVLLYMILNWILDNDYGLRKNISALLAWETIGNSNWFVWVILMLYLVTWAALTLIPSRVGQLTAVTVATGVYALIFHQVYPDFWWWYDTAFCYAAGMWYACFQPQIEGFLSRDSRYWGTLAGTAAVFLVLFYFRDTAIPVYQLLSVVFSLLVVLVTMKVRLGNKVICWFGQQVFTIYILQRLPMIVLERLGAAANPWLFLAGSFLATVALAAAFDRALRLFDQKVLKIGG